MRKFLLASAAALAVIATPAAARDGAGYAGLEGGLTFPENMDIDGAFLFDDPLTPDLLEDRIGHVEFKAGLDVDLIAGYDFGMFRLEGELGWKRSKADVVDFDNDFVDELDPDAEIDISERITVLSGMVNGLVDLGPAYVGAGFGRASVKAFDESDSAWAWQLIAGFRAPVSDSVDLGVKYRYFRTGGLDLREDFVEVDGVGFVGTSDRFSSHSILASLIFNFGAPRVDVPPPAPVVAPPPPPPPATQTCPDGSVILATDMCPAPPPPPPPPASPGERGQ